MYIKRKV